MGLVHIKQGRNERCNCGSGKKYKKCCLENDKRKEHYISVPPELLEQLFHKKEVEPHLNLVLSIKWNGFRCRAIWNTIHFCPIKQTFHEFLIDVLLHTFGKDWHDAQLLLSQDKRHIVMKWKFSYFEWTKTTFESSIEKKVDGFVHYGAIPSGEVKAFLQLGYDLYCLQVINKLPQSLINRLIDYREFQGARYEVAVASMIARAGFEIEFFDKKFKDKKQCEFIATHKDTGISFGVEAKSRRRPGVLHEEEQLDRKMELRGDVWRLFNKAIKQKPEHLPFLIFIDLNLPSIVFEETEQDNQVIKDLHKLIFEDYGKASSNNRDPYNMVVFTNYSYYYSGDGESTSGQCFVATSKFPQTEMNKTELLNEIFESVQRYGYIPDEV